MPIQMLVVEVFYYIMLTLKHIARLLQCVWMCQVWSNTSIVIYYMYHSFMLFVHICALTLQPHPLLLPSSNTKLSSLKGKFPQAKSGLGEWEAILETQ